MIKKMLFGTVLKMLTDIGNEGNMQTYSHRWTMTYATARKNIYEFERLGLITTEKDGRQTIIRLTEKGKRLSNIFKEADAILKEGNNAVQRKEKTHI